MITKSTFVKTIDRLQLVSQIASTIENNLTDGAKKLDTDFLSMFGAFTAHESTVVNLLEEIFNDQECNVITWWLYETDYGKNKKYNTITNEKGDAELIDSAGKLYDYLFTNM